MKTNSKKLLTIILSVLAALLFLVSALYNILVYKSSYGSLMFKYDEVKYYVMHDIATQPFSYTYLQKETKNVVKISGENIDGCDVFTTEYYVNKESKIFIKTTCSVEEDETTYYYDGTTVYIYHGDENSKKDLSLGEYFTYYPDFFGFAQTFLFDTSLTSNKNNKTKIDFSFSPFYTFGIKYSYSLADTSYTYKYDLYGRLRKIIIEDSVNKSTYRIDYTSEKFSLPNSK